MSDIDLSNLLKVTSRPPKKDEDRITSPPSSAPSRPGSSPGGRGNLDGQITEYKEGGDAEGIKSVESMLQTDPENVDLMDWLAFLYYSNNRLDDAINLYKKLLAKQHKVDTQYFYLGNAYYKKGLTQVAIEQWKRAVAAAPGSPMARKAEARITAAQQG